jgi:hypothetical protein
MKFSEFRLLAAFFLLFAIQSCKRDEPTSWQPDVLAPLAYGKLTLNQMLVDSIYQADNAGLWHVVVNEDLTNFDLDSLIEIPDTTIARDFPIYIFGAIAQGFTLVFPTSRQVELDLPTAQLKHIRMKGGRLKYKIESPVDGILNCTINFPGLTLNGASQSILIQTTPPDSQAFSITEGFLDLAGLELSMTGQSGFSFNRFVYQVGVVVAPDAPTPASVGLADEFRFELTFEDAQIDYARGYFGQHVFSFDEQVDFDAFSSIPAAVFDINGASTTFSLRNAIGVDAQMNFNQISNWNNTNQTEVNLQNSTLFNTINLSRAQDNGGSVNESLYTAELNSSNSNLDAFLENLPNSIRVKGDLRVNPLGNVSTSNDFIYIDNSLKADLQMDIPLRIGIQNLVLSDTIALSDSEQDIPVEGKLMLWVKNGFALEATAGLYALHADGRELIASNLRLSPAISGENLDSTIPTETWIEIPITDALLQAKDLLIEVALQTPDGAGPVGLYANQAIDFKLLVNGTYSIEYGQ